MAVLMIAARLGARPCTDNNRYVDERDVGSSVGLAHLGSVEVFRFHRFACMACPPADSPGLCRTDARWSGS